MAVALDTKQVGRVQDRELLYRRGTTGYEPIEGEVDVYLSTYGFGIKKVSLSPNGLDKFDDVAGCLRHGATMALALDTKQGHFTGQFLRNI